MAPRNTFARPLRAVALATAALLDYILRPLRRGD